MPLSSRGNYELKILMLGDLGVGKTSTVKRFITASFQERYKPTLGTEVLVKELTVDSIPVILQIWDLAGAANFKSIRASFYRGTSGAFLLCDLTREETLKNLSEWVREVDGALQQRPVYFLLGNKSDLQSDRQVSPVMLERAAQEFGTETYLETSAKTGTNVDEAFYRISQVLIKKEKSQL
jgi:small GTP-binding protein